MKNRKEIIMINKIIKMYEEMTDNIIVGKVIETILSQKGMMKNVEKYYNASSYKCWI